MSSAQCQHCGSTEIDKDPARGDAVCTQCGSVLEESVIVTEVQYAQDSHGNSRAIGKLVSSEDGIASGLSLGHRLLGRESRATTLQKARHNIQLLASKLQLNNRCMDTAFNFYKVALSRKLTTGRKNTHVIAACVYMVCRKEETAHMLLDLSDILQVSVYELGKTYLKLSTALCINSPAIDPSLYILRFAHQLEFGKKTHEVSMTAARLVQRMKKDWMHTGRRPSGLCGAALLVAARLHNFNRTVDDIIKVVKVCQATVRKRLTEFSETPSSRLTLEEFMTIDLEEEQDPPAFKNARKKIHEEMDENKMAELKKQVAEIQRIIERALENSKRKCKSSKLIEPATDDSVYETASPSSPGDIEACISKSTLETINTVLSNEVSPGSSLPTEVSLTPTLTEGENSISSGYISDSQRSHGLEPTAEMLGIKDRVVAKVPESQSEQNVFLDITDLDDDELDNYIMDQGEVKEKNDLWHVLNADYLKEQKEKQEKKAREEEENADKEKKKRRRQKRVQIQASTAGEAIEKMLQQKRISFKLNYDVLKNLNPDEKQTEDTPELSIKPDTVSPQETPLRRRVQSRSTKPKIPQAPVLKIKKGISDIIGNTRKKMLESLANNVDHDDDEIKEPPLKVAKLDDENSPLDVVDNEIVPRVISSNSNIVPDDDDDDDDDSEGEDLTQMTEEEIINYHRNTAMPEYYDDDYQDYDD